MGSAPALKAVSNAGRADGPAVIRLMAGEAGPPIGSKVLEERIVLGECLSVGLERCDRTARVPVNFKFWNNIRCRLGALIPIFETAHRLHMIDHARGKGRHARSALRESGLGHRRLRNTAHDAGQNSPDGRNAECFD